MANESFIVLRTESYFTFKSQIYCHMYGTNLTSSDVQGRLEVLFCRFLVWMLQILTLQVNMGCGGNQANRSVHVYIYIMYIINTGGEDRTSLVQVLMIPQSHTQVHTFTFSHALPPQPSLHLWSSGMDSQYGFRSHWQRTKIHHKELQPQETLSNVQPKFSRMQVTSIYTSVKWTENRG